MIIECSSCKSKYKYDEAKLAGGSKKIKCPKCKGVIEVHPPEQQVTTAAKPVGAATLDRTYASIPLPDDLLDNTDPAAGSSPKTAKVRKEALQAMAGGEEFLKMPEGSKFSLAVIQGQESGEIFQINKPRMTIGRSDADIVIKDMEASRQHARIDIMGDRVILRDLNSTNGTFVDEQRISSSNLDNRSEFRIGTTVLMLIITDIE
ncbi:MAG: hypothetical protein C5B54_08570 [Acidobacteria bacterium]|nr:MAG: hypothetical protein C5B54_08570 [Acidobacteriota bacterium]